MPQIKRSIGWCQVRSCRRTTPMPPGWRGTQCSTCLRAKRERRPLLYRGACTCGCGRPAGGRSALARICYLRAHRRRRAFTALMKDVVGIPLPPDALLTVLTEQLAAAALYRRPALSTLETRRAIQALRGLLQALAIGRLGVYRYVPGHGARATSPAELNTPSSPVDKSGPDAAQLPPTN
jgi:hypothetical protein